MTLAEYLAQGWCLLYSPAEFADTLKPGQALTVSIKHVNRCLHEHGRCLSTWPWGDQNIAAKLVRVNWIYQRLGKEPIRKPILIDANRVVQCGDTRLASLSLLPGRSVVSAVACVPSSRRDRWTNWQDIANEQQLIAASGFAANAKIDFSGNEHGMHWLEIGDASTAHHLHDQELRTVMMQRHIDQQPSNFEFSIEWCRSAVDWNSLT